MSRRMVDLAHPVPWTYHPVAKSKIGSWVAFAWCGRMVLILKSPHRGFLPFSQCGLSLQLLGPMWARIRRQALHLSSLCATSAPGLFRILSWHRLLNRPSDPSHCTSWFSLSQLHLKPKRLPSEVLGLDLPTDLHRSFARSAVLLATCKPLGSTPWHADLVRDFQAELVEEWRKGYFSEA